ncbi:MAG: hypothetical protein AB8B53_14950 [Flavobacteriales bacterium]
MTKHLLVLSTLAMLSAVSVNSQQLEDSKHFKFKSTDNIQIEAGGVGVFYSVMYEKFIVNRHRFKTSINMGGSYYGENANVVATALFYTNINQIYSISANHHLEIGIGLMGAKENLGNLPEFARQDNYIPFLSGRIGYRYQKPDGKLTIRAACTPLVENFSSQEVYPWPSLALGYAF